MSVDNVVPIGIHAAHVTGRARCLNCRHEWVAVVPFLMRLDLLECSACGHVKGFFPHHFIPPPSTHVLTCDCGNDLLYVCDNGCAFCPSCADYLLIDRT